MLYLDRNNCLETTHKDYNYGLRKFCQYFGKVVVIVIV